MYAYEHVGVPEHEGAIKVGYTTRTAEERIGEQNRTAGLRYKILRQWSAMRNEQRRAVERTACYFTAFAADPDNHGFTPHFLWNAKLLHKTFGEGVVEALDEKYLFVTFGKQTKKFLRDVAFAKGYLSRN